MKDIKDEYGRGTYVYFYYIRFLGLYNLFLGAIALITFAAAASTADPAVLDSKSGVELLFISWYPADLWWLWAATSVLLMLATFAIGPTYAKYQQSFTKDWEGAERTEEIERDDEIILYDKNGARITTTSGSRQTRKYISLFCFVCAVALQGLFTWELHVLLAEASGSTTAQVIAIAISLMNMVWKQLGKQLTIFERHRTWTEYREWDCGKVFVLKLSNVLVLYIVKAVQNQQQAPNSCPLDSIAYQFFWLIFYDLTLNNIVELAVPFGMTYIKQKMGKSSGGDNSSKPKFDLAEEYVEVLYRQFIILLGMLVFPPILLVAALAYFLEHWLDKMRLLYICQKPTKREEPLRENLVTIFSLVTSIAALLSFPNGSVWILAGVQMNDCAFYK